MWRVAPCTAQLDSLQVMHILCIHTCVSIPTYLYIDDVKGRSLPSTVGLFSERNRLSHSHLSHYDLLFTASVHNSPIHTSRSQLYRSHLSHSRLHSWTLLTATLSLSHSHLPFTDGSYTKSTRLHTQKKLIRGGD